MANDTPKINISSLDFAGIKDSFKEYLKTIPELSDYDYSGSAINLLLDVFAYNTLYYAYYANMLANEMFLQTAQLENNVSSLLRPLGVVLPSKSCSVGEITAIAKGTTSSFISYQDYLIGTNSKGLTYRFYTIENINLDATNKTFKVYEATTIANDIDVTSQVDITQQRLFVANTDVDIRTIRIKVNNEIWSLYDNNIAGPEAKIFFIDRTSSGFYVLFGKRTINDLANNYGKNITANDTIKISYLIPTGQSADGVSSYGTSSVMTIKSVVSSAGGKDAPDLDLYRYSAPKFFAANDRAVTKDDYYGLLLNSGVLPAGIDSEQEINVWGGEEANPPAFGRVFISFANEGLTAGDYSVKNSISYIKRKSMITALPEYVQPQIITANVDLNIIGGSSSYYTAIKNIVNSYYNTTLKFNNKILATEIKSEILKQYTITGLSINNISLTLEAYGSVTDRNLYFKNEFATVSNTAISKDFKVLKSELFTYASQNVFLGDYPTIYNTSGESIEGVLYLYKSPSQEKISTTPVGRIDYKNGVITVYPNILPTSTKTKITVQPKYPDTLVFNNEFLLKANTTINGL